MSAIATVQPLPHGLRLYSLTTAERMPEITTVSNPKSRPPSAPVRVAFIRFTLGRMVSCSLFNQNHRTDRPQSRQITRPTIPLVDSAHSEAQFKLAPSKPGL